MKDQFAHDLGEVKDQLAEARRTRFTLLMAVIVAAVTGVFQVILHFVPTGHGG